MSSNVMSAFHLFVFQCREVATWVFHTYYRHGVVKNVILPSSIPSRLLVILPLPLHLELPRPLLPPLLTPLLILIVSDFYAKTGTI